MPVKLLGARWGIKSGKSALANPSQGSSVWAAPFRASPVSIHTIPREPEGKQIDVMSTQTFVEEPMANCLFTYRMSD